MKQEDSYKQGDTANYLEGGERARVEIVRNNSDDEKIAYDLMLLEKERKSDLFKKIKLGDTFTFSKVRMYQDHPIFGHLEEE